MYFNYHAKIQRLIKEKHAVYYEYLESYHNISPCLLIHFDDGVSYPIRKHKFDEYEFLLAKFDIPRKN